MRCSRPQDLPTALDFDDAPAGAGTQWDFLLRLAPARFNHGMFDYRASQYDTSEPKDEVTIRAEDHYQDIFDVHRSALYAHLLEHRLTCPAHRVHEGGSLGVEGGGSEQGETGSDGGESEEAPEYDPEFWDTYIVCAGGPRRRVMLIRTPPGGLLPPHDAQFW